MFFRDSHPALGPSKGVPKPSNIRTREIKQRFQFWICGCDLIAPPLAFSGDAIPSQGNECVPKTGLESTTRLAYRISAASHKADLCIGRIQKGAFLPTDALFLHT